MGTAQYVSPEILTNSGCSPALDLWALGCIIYQMVTGIPPFQGNSEYLIFQKVRPQLSINKRVETKMELLADSESGLQFL